MASDGEISCTNDPNFAVIYSFLKVFGNLYGLEIPSIAKLHNLIEDTQEVLDPLRELHIRLLRRALKSVQTNRWEKSLIKFCHQQGFHQEAWEIERFSYKKASTQVKLKILKVLLEYQFTCHPKFKTAVNALSCKELRLDPIGRDKNGCVYWLQIDDDANLCLYKEDQDEETWQLIARNREELVKVIAQLKSGEEICSLNISNNEDSSSAELPPQVELNKLQAEDEDDNEEFLSPESETDDDFDEQDTKIEEEPKKYETEKNDVNNDLNTEIVEELKKSEESNKSIECSAESKEEEVSEAIEEPVMVVTGEGNGADCESAYIVGEEITDPILFVYGEGCGYDNETGNPELASQANSHDENSDEETTVDEFINGEYPTEVPKSRSKNRPNKNARLKDKVPAVTKRSLRKQTNESVETVKSESKKHCIRHVKKTNKASTNSNSKENNLKTEEIVKEENTTEHESPSKNNIKKSKGKNKKTIKEKKTVLKKEESIQNDVSEADCNQDKKSSIIEKRKSSLSSDQDEHIQNNEHVKEIDDNEKMKTDDSLPPKKLRLETTIESDNSSHSKETVNKIKICKAENSSNEKINNEAEPASKRKKVKASKNKSKRKSFLKDKDNILEKTNENVKNNNEQCNKSLKRSLLDATHSDKNKSESQSDTEDDTPITSGKRLKMKPKKIVTSSRKKVEAAKLQIKNSSDESEEETLCNLAIKKSSKRPLKKKSKTKGKSEVTKGQAEDDTPVRQSRRIAQMKIKEEADRRHLEEVALRELKKIHKKTKEDEDEWHASASSSESEAKPRKHKTWRASDSTGPDADSDSEEPLFEPEEPDLEFGKSDHEFSPESDLESGEPVEPLKRARTLQEGKDNGFCKRCGSGEQPEWILLCDQCDEGYHASCLKPMLFLIPEGDWFCPPCNHEKLIASLENELVKYDELRAKVEEEKAQLLLQKEPEPAEEEDKKSDREKEEKASSEKSDSESSGSGYSSSSSAGAVYRLRARRQLPVSYRSQEYDRLISSAIKEEYVEPTTSAGNQGRGKDISTIIEAAEEEKLKAEREAIEQGKPVEVKKMKKKQRRKPRKLNSLEVLSEDDDEIDEDFKDTGMESSSEDISSSADRDSSSSGSSDSAPVRRSARSDKKERRKLVESSPEVKKKKKGVFEDSSSDSAAKERKKSQSKSKSRSRRRDRSSPKKPRKRGGLTQYDSEGNVIRARVTYGGLSDENDWSPKHRTRQKKINYTEMPNTESEDEMHKSSGKHMPDSSDEFKVEDSDVTSGSDSDRIKRKKAAEESDEDRKKALCDLIRKTAVVPLNKLPEDVVKVKTEELQALAAENEHAAAKAARGRGSRGGRSSRGRGGRTVRAMSGGSDDALAKLVGVKIKDLREDGTVPLKPNQVEREKKRLEREAKQAEKEARRIERLQKKEEKEKLKEQRAKEREEKKQARIAMLESKKIKKEKDMQMHAIPIGGIPVRPVLRPERPPFPARDYGEHRFPHPPRLQVRAELRGVLPGPELRLRAESPHMREGTLSVAGSPQPFKPVSEEPSVITRMPHMVNQQYRGQMMYPPGTPPYGPPPRTSSNLMYGMHPSLQGPPRQQYQQRFYPPGYPATAVSGQAIPMRAPPPRPLGPHPVPITITQSGQIPGNLNPNQSRIISPPQPGAPPGDSGLSTTNQPPPTSSDEPIKIKTEVKTEPEYHSPSHSPPAREEILRNHPKIKHTENKDRRPRFPLGPYAPQYGPYGPYAPPMTSQPQDVRSPLLNLQLRGLPPNAPPNMHQYHPQRHSMPPEQSRSPQRPPGSQERPPHPMMPHDMPPHLGPYMPPMQQHLRPQMRPPYGMQMMQRPPPDRNSPQRIPHPPPPYHQFPDIPRSLPDKQMAPLPPNLTQKSPPPRALEAVLKAENHSPVPPGANVQRVIPPVDPSRNDNHQVLPSSDTSKIDSPVSQPYPKPDASAPPSYLKLNAALTQPFLKVNTSITQPYLKSDASVPQPYQKVEGPVPPPYSKVDDSVPLTYSKVDPTVPPPYSKVDSPNPPPYSKMDNPVPVPYSKPDSSIPIQYSKVDTPVSQPYLNDAVPQPFLKTDNSVNKPNEVPVKLEQIKVEDSQDSNEETPREEGSVFGGLVSYFSSQREDDIDA